MEKINYCLINGNNVMTNIQSTEHLCLECRACEQICPKDAIFMQENTEGFSYPHVDAAK